ncbi:Predicted phospholipase, patatin/cPLA2 family [Halarsenatibacter silvermanii]|uniref:Predicted phospholipase, patatin/cPLA2 family n=2 Tax=Halarsenatibacter silvermanii TaxID=321763 RepID=A0A1G9RXG6_9FIRM|nr:Predicted phospholipase, patatin/cPLA2 family [Halarsenatibacter silvermanii]
MRGAYTAGVLDLFLEEEIMFPYIIGVSAGANNGANFVAGQKERSKRIFLNYSQKKRFMGLKNLLKKRNYFGMDFIYEVLPFEIDPFDFEAFANSSAKFKVVLTDRESGNPVYMEHKDYCPEFFVKKILRASSTLPLICSPVKIEDNFYLDGGISAPIPVKKAIRDGYKYNVLVLTREEDYYKKPAKIRPLFKLFYRNFPGLLQKLQNRHNIYNECLNFVRKLEENNRVFVFRPQNEVKVNILENDRQKIKDLYEKGYSETKNRMENFKEWAKEITSSRAIS